MICDGRHLAADTCLHSMHSATNARTLARQSKRGSGKSISLRQRSCRASRRVVCCNVFARSARAPRGAFATLAEQSQKHLVEIRCGTMFFIFEPIGQTATWSSRRTRQPQYRVHPRFFTCCSAACRATDPPSLSHSHYIFPSPETRYLDKTSGTSQLSSNPLLRRGQPISISMLASTIAGRAAVRASRQGQRTVAAKLTSGAITAASPCSNLRSPLPGAYRETTELWHNDKAADAPADAVETVKNEAELTKLLASDGLVVVKFHAILCDASRAVEGRFRQTAAEFGDMDGKQVTFADVCFDSNRQLCKRMGIKSVPHVQIFSGSKGKIADFSIAPLQYNTLTSLLSERRDSVAAGGQL